MDALIYFALLAGYGLLLALPLAISPLRSFLAARRDHRAVQARVAGLTHREHAERYHPEEWGALTRLGRERR